LEYGTVKMAAQPYLRPALDDNKTAIERYMAEIYRAAIKAVTG
jgi:HK97 gp10 family phage protein